MPTFYLDYENGNDNYSGTSFDLLASGTDGAITSSTFSSATANFANDNTIAPLKNICWHTNFWQGYGSSNGCRLLSLNYTDEVVAGPTGINSYIYYLQENALNTSYLVRTQAAFLTIANSTQYTISAYIKSAGRNKIIFQWANDTTKSVRFNLSSGTIEASGANASAAISDAGGGWYRLSMTITTSASAASELFAFYLTQDTYNGLDAANISYVGDPTKGIYFTGIQIEASSSVTTYENPPAQTLSIFNGSIYAYYHIVERLSSTSLRIVILGGGTALANTSARQYYIGGRLKTFTSGLTAVRINSCDIIRVEASPDPTSIGNATWSGTGSYPTINIFSSTNASPISITTSASHSYSTGDTVFICDHTGNTNANGTWEITVTGSTTFTLTGSTGNSIGTVGGTVRKATNCVIRLASSLTENIASHGNVGEGRTVWTATTNNTATTTVGTKQGNVGDSISIGAAFTTGLVAYKSFSTKDLSGYQQLSFYIYQTAGTVAASGQLQLKLCSDTAGATAVNTFNIPALGALNVWHVFTIDLATNLGNDIQSIGLYTTSDAGAQTFLLSNIIVCKASSSADSLSLTSIIGKNTTNESWYPIQSIVGTRVIIDGRLATNPVSAAQGSFTKGYYGTTETITTYKRETIKTFPLASSFSVSIHQILDSVPNFSPNIEIQGGYDRTNMSNQNGITFFDGTNGLGYGINANARAGFTYAKLGFVRYDRMLLNNINFSYLKNIYALASSSNAIDLSTASQYNKFENLFLNNSQLGGTVSFGFNKNKFTNCYISNNNLRGLDLGTYNNNVWNNCYFNNNGSFGMVSNAGGGSNNTWNNCEFINNQNEAYRTQGVSYNDTFNNCVTSGNISSGFFSFGGSIYLNNCLINESVEFGFYGGSDGRIYCFNHDNVSNNSYIYTDFGLIRPQTSVRYSNTGYAWSMTTTSAYRTNDYPLAFAIAKVAVSANSLVIIKAWMRRDNAGFVMRLKLKGGQIAGINNDVVSYITAGADTWEQVSISFTPTEAGVVEILVECWGGSTFTGYIDDLTIIQV